jgi:hypothetical protein
MRRVDISSDFNHLKNEAKYFESFCLALGKSTDTSDTAQLLVVIRDIRESVEVAEELDSRKICTEQQRRLLFDCV